MLSLKSIPQQKIERALNKAQSCEISNPFSGIYQVPSATTEGVTYTVDFEKKNGKALADCNCTAGKRGELCWHVIAAGQLYKQELVEKAAEKVACRNCNEAEAEIDGLCKPCMDAKVREDFSDLFGHN